MVTNAPDKKLGDTWQSWFSHPQFYQVGWLYMMSRLVVNVTQVNPRVDLEVLDDVEVIFGCVC